MKYPTPKHTTKILALLVTLALPTYLEAANVSLTASDGSGTTSMTNTVGKWGPDSTGLAALPPQATNDYYTGPFFMRTPPNNFGYTFAGHSLTLQDVSGNPGSGGQGAPFRSILYKGSGGDTIIINNLTNAAGSVLNQGGSGNLTATFTGNLWTIAGNSTIISDQGSTIIGYPIVGSANLTNSGSAQSGVHPITYTGDLSGFTGRLILFNLNGGMTVNLNAGSSNLGNPATFTPDQLTLGLGATLVDNVGITFNNPNAGFTLTGNASVNAASTTVIAEPITDKGSNYVLTTLGGGTVRISAPSTYGGGTTISAGILQIGVANALTNSGSITDNGQLDLNGISTTINALSGAGTVDNSAAGSPTLTIGSMDGGATFSGTVQNSAGTLSVTKVGAGTETFSGAYLVSGTTTVAGGTLNLTTASGSASIPGGFVVSNGATMTANVSLGNPLPAASVLVGTNSTLTLNLSSTANGINATSLTLQDNATNNFSYGTLTINPSLPAIDIAGGISAPGTNIVINVAASGLQPGTFTLIKYTGTALGSIANFQVSPPPGVAAILINNTVNHSIDLQITSIPNQLVWNGVNGTAWNLTTANWSNTVSGAITVFGQYTNGAVVAGDSVTFDDSVTNDFVNPQPTNIVLNSRFFAFPVVFNSTLPYTIAGSGGIAGVTSLAISNTGSLTLLTSNSFSGGVNIAGGSLTITNDSALGASSGSLIVNGSTLQINGGVTNSRAVSVPAIGTIGVSANNIVRFAGQISGGGASLHKTDAGTLVLAARETFTGNLFLHAGTTVIDTGGSITNGSYHDAGQNGNDVATLTIKGTGAFSTTSDFNAGDLDNSSGTLNLQDTATMTVNAIYVGSANAAGSTASGVVNQSGGTLTELSATVGTFSIGGRTSASGVGVYNMSGGTITATAGIRVGGTGVGTLNQSGGTINALGGINIARIVGSFGTNNLNGGTLATLNVASSTGTNAVFNFNGGTLLAQNPSSPWFASVAANILAGGAIIDTSTNNVGIFAPLLAGSPNGGLTKKGSATLTLFSTNNFTGSITNLAGTLALSPTNGSSTYNGGLSVNAGTVQLNTASTFKGNTFVTNGALLSVIQVGSSVMTLSNLIFSGGGSGSGATLGLTPTSANNTNVALVNCGTLTLNGTNTVSLAAVNIGTTALIKYFAIAGSGNITNLNLPQGATGYVSNNVANSTLYAVVVSTGPGLVWTGTNTLALNTWNINGTTNWLVGSTPTSYHQIITPGDSVIFNDVGNGTVLLNTNVAPAGIVISNSTKIYTFSGSGSLSGSTGLQKLGNNTVILSLTNSTYTGTTIVSNGTVQIGGLNALSPAANLVMGATATLQLSGFTTTVGELTGGGTIDNNSGINPVLTVGGNGGGTWNGTIRDHNAGGVALHKVGAGTWVVGGTNTFNDGQAFSDQNQINAGTVIITNGGVVQMATMQLQIANGAGSVAAVVMAGGTLAVSNNLLSVGFSTNATGSLTVNSGTIVHTGTTAGAGFAPLPNGIAVGTLGATGTLILNGGQVLNDLPLYLGDGSTSSGTLDLNGGLLQASALLANNTPALSLANFNGGTLQATTNSGDFLQVSSMVMSNGLVLDDGGFAVTISSQSLQSGDAFNGGLIKQGSGTVYIDSSSGYTGTTLVTNGTLAGVGSIVGPVVVAPGGTLGAGDAPGLGAFNIFNNLTLQGNVALRIDKTGGNPSQDQVAVSGNISYGGVLTITNTTSDATPLANGDTFQLFSVSGTHSSNFSGISGSPGTGLAYSFNPVSGILSVVTSTIANNPTNISFSVVGSSLNLSWPADHLGWILQTQTNSLATGLTTNWVDVAGSDGVTSTNLPIVPFTPDAFFRLRHP